MTLEEVIASTVRVAVREEARAVFREELAKLQPSPTGKLLTLTKAAAETGYSSETLRRWIKAGKLPAHRPEGGHPRVRLEDVEKCVAAEPSPDEEDSPEAFAARVLAKKRGG